MSKLITVKDLALTASQNLRAELVNLNEQSDLLTKVEQTLLHISTKVLGQSVETVDKLVTTGLRVVFDDQVLEFKTATTRQRGRTGVKFDLLDGGIPHPLADSFGGGVLAVVGVLLRVTTIMSLDLRRVLFLDESLSHVAPKYVDNTSALLKKICDELDFTISLVSHTPEFASQADNHFEASKSASGTVFRREQRNPVAV